MLGLCLIGFEASLILEYQYRVEALMSKIAFLEAQLEVVNNQLNK